MSDHLFFQYQNIQHSRINPVRKDQRHDSEWLQFFGGAGRSGVQIQIDEFYKLKMKNYLVILWE
jgi:hypothetical protein